MAYENGQLPSSELAAISGNPGKRLRKDAAAAFNTMYREHVVKLADAYRMLGAPGDLARGTWSQWAAWERYQAGGNLAAYPGRSVHGWGLAIDVASYYDRLTIDHIGAKYGFAKAWSDAPSEYWHVCWKEGVWTPATIWPIGEGDTGDRVHQVQRAMQARGHDIQADGSYGPLTAGAVRVFETNHRLPIGPVTVEVWNFMFPILHLGSPWPGAITALQHVLHIPATGRFFTPTATAVKLFQRTHSLTADGVVGPITWERLLT